jgi:hypothetical protein
MVLLARLASRRGNRLRTGGFRSREPSRYDEFLPYLLEDLSSNTAMQEFPIRLFKILELVTTSSYGRVLKLECLSILIECSDSQASWSHTSDIE